MAREEFIDNLWAASGMLPPMKVNWPGGRTTDFSGDPWLTSRSVEGFDPADFTDWTQGEQDQLKRRSLHFSPSPRKFRRTSRRPKLRASRRASTWRRP